MSSSPQNPKQSRDSQLFEEMFNTVLDLCGDEWDTEFALRRAMRRLTLDQLGQVLDDVCELKEAEGGSVRRQLLNERFGDPKSDRL